MYIASTTSPREEPVAARLPQDMCCNCGSGDEELTVIQTDLRRKLFLGIGGVEAQLIVPLPYCRGCKRTALVRKPSIFDAAVWWGIWSLFAWFGLMGAVVIAGQKTHRFGLVYAIGAVLVTIGSILWYRRPPRSNRITNYQPARLLNFDSAAPVEERVAFSNPTYARRVVEAVGAHVPAARVVKR
ncbi:MAG: hypothetical protein R3B06_03565 [Kofleriaceae bacterium]